MYIYIYIFYTNSFPIDESSNNNNNKIERLPFSPLNSSGRRIYLVKTVRNCISAVNLREFYIRDADDSRFRPGQQITRRLSLSLSLALRVNKRSAVHLSLSPSSREGAVVYGVLSRAATTNGVGSEQRQLII